MAASGGDNALNLPHSENSSGGYSQLQRRLHWIVAALVVVQLLVGLWIGTTPRQPQNLAFIRNLLILHLATGTVIFGLMFKRWSLRRKLGAPPPSPGTPFDAAMLARLNHYGFYLLLLVMPVIGWLAYLSDRPGAHMWGSLHGALALTLLVAICAHLAGVIYHTAIRHDGVLRRMTG